MSESITPNPRSSRSGLARRRSWLKTTPPPRNSRSDLTRRRARLAGPLLIAALLTPAGVLSAATPVAAQTTIWSATLTAEDLAQNISFGCSVHVSGSECSGLLSVNTFTFEGQTYEITVMSFNSNTMAVTLVMSSAITDSMLEWDPADRLRVVAVRNRP